MKRLKYFLLISSLACTIGCQKQNPVMVPIEGSNDEVIAEDITEDNIKNENVTDSDTENQEETVSEFEEGTPEYLFDKFLKGEIDAKPLPSLDRKESVNIADLNVDPIEWSFDSYSVGEQLDLDNDGENELILDGPYGGMYLDAIDGNLYIFVEALGNAGALSYTFYENAYWIVISDTTHANRLDYTLYKYEGGEKIVDIMELYFEKTGENEGTFTFNGNPVSEEELLKIKNEIFSSNSNKDSSRKAYDNVENLYQAYYNFILNYNDYEWDGRYCNMVSSQGEDYGWDSFQLIDFDGDGSDELIVSNRSDNRLDAGMQYYLIVDWYDGEIVITELCDGVASAGGYRGKKYYLPGKGIIYDDKFSAPYGNPGFSVYKFSEGKFEFGEGGNLEPNREFEYPENLGNGTWYWDGKEVTEEEYKKLTEENSDNFSGIALEDIDYLDKDSMLDILEKNTN